MCLCVCLSWNRGLGVQQSSLDYSLLDLGKRVALLAGPQVCCLTHPEGPRQLSNETSTESSS